MTKGFPEMIRLARRFGVMLEVVTNATLLNDADEDLLLGCTCRVIFSFDGADKESSSTSGATRISKSRGEHPELRQEGEQARRPPSAAAWLQRHAHAAEHPPAARRSCGWRTSSAPTSSPRTTSFRRPRDPGGVARPRPGSGADVHRRGRRGRGGNGVLPQGPRPRPVVAANAHGGRTGPPRRLVGRDRRGARKSRCRDAPAVSHRVCPAGAGGRRAARGGVEHERRIRVASRGRPGSRSSTADLGLPFLWSCRTSSSRAAYVRVACPDRPRSAASRSSLSRRSGTATPIARCASGS